MWRAAFFPTEAEVAPIAVKPSTLCFWFFARSGVALGPTGRGLPFLMAAWLYLQVHSDRSGKTRRLSSPFPKCACCAQPGAMFRDDGQPPLCALCHLPTHLDRPSIDDEAVLIWLPELDQRALSVICRELHLQLRAAGEKMDGPAEDGAVSQSAAGLRTAESALLQRSEGAVVRLGSDRPSELAEALRLLPSSTRERQSELLGGLRLLPRGRFFAEHQDIYPEIVDAWRAPATAAGGT